MLQFFQLSRSGEEKLDITALAQQPENTTYSSDVSLWANLEDPNEDEVRHLSDSLNIPIDFLIDSLDLAERPRASHNANATLIITSAPYLPTGPSAELAANEEQAYRTVPIGIILLNSTVITVSRVRGLVESLLGKPLMPEQASANVCLAMNILQKTSARFIKYLQRLNEIGNQIEETMRKSTGNKDLHRILQLAKTLVYFLNALKGNDLVLDKLLHTETFSWKNGEKELLNDALIDCKQAASMADVHAQITANMSDIYASMISNNMNQVVKFLTAITLILTAPAIISSLYGMNVPIPFQDSIWSLPLILLGIFIVCWLLWLYLSKKHWL